MAELEIGSNYGRGISSIVRECVTPVGKREIFGQRFLREESVSVSEKRNCSPTPLVNLRWTQLSENFLLIRKDPSAISEKRQPTYETFHKLPIQTRNLLRRTIGNSPRGDLQL